MSQRALLIIDIQNDYFPGGKWPLVGMEQASKNAAAVLSAMRAAGDLIVHVHHEFEGADAPFFTPGSTGAQIHPSVQPHAGEPTVLKHAVNAFSGTALKELLDQHGIQELVVVGSMSHMCIDAVVRAGADFGYAVTVIHDACATHDQEFAGTHVPAAQVHAAFMAGLAFAYANLSSAEAFLAA